MLSEAKHLSAHRERPFAEFTLSGANVLRKDGSIGATIVNTGKNGNSGSFTITPTITIAIPANTFAGTYTSTVNVAIASGP